MSLEFEKDSFLSLKRLSANNHYYNEVFKRAERIASVVFYVLSYIEQTNTSTIHHKNLSDKAMRVHETVIATLALHEYEAKDGLFDFMQAVVALESALHLASAARVITNDVDRVISEEVDTLERVVRNHYLAPEEKESTQTKLNQTNTQFSAPTDTSTSDQLSRPATPAPARAPRQSSPRSTAGSPPAGDMSSHAKVAYRSAPGRVDRIKTVLEAKGEATIKDIAEVITDCSEKTIQRDLNSLIDSGEVIREGERRWSRYRINKS